MKSGSQHLYGDHTLYEFVHRLHLAVCGNAPFPSNKH